MYMYICNEILNNYDKLHIHSIKIKKFQLQKGLTNIKMNVQYLVMSKVISIITEWIVPGRLTIIQQIFLSFFLFLFLAYKCMCSS